MTKEEFLRERICKLRILKGVSAREMSLSIGQNENYINHIENGKTMPSMQVFFYICEYLKITPELFFTEEMGNPVGISGLVTDLANLSERDLELVLALLQRLQNKP